MCTLSQTEDCPNSNDDHRTPYFWFWVNWLIVGDHSGLGWVAKGFLKKKFGDCWCKINLRGRMPFLSLNRLCHSTEWSSSSSSRYYWNWSYPWTAAMLPLVTVCCVVWCSCSTVACLCCPLPREESLTNVEVFICCRISYTITSSTGSCVTSACNSSSTVIVSPPTLCKSPLSAVFTCLQVAKFGSWNYSFWLCCLFCIQKFRIKLLVDSNRYPVFLWKIISAPGQTWISSRKVDW